MLTLTRIFSIPIAILIICAIFYNVISNHILGNSSYASLPYDPFNFQNRVKYLNLVIIQPEIDPDEIKPSKAMIDASMKNEPLNARMLALAGVIKSTTDIEAAQQNYVKALDIKPTDRLALTQRYLYLVENRKYSEAIPIYVLISARYPAVFKKLLPSTPLLLQSPDNRDLLLSSFKSREKFLHLMVGSMVKNPADIDLASDLVLNAYKDYNFDVHLMSRPVIVELMKQGRFSDAYLLFYKTLSEEEKKNVGYVYNSKFSTEPIASNFDWDIKPQAGVIMKRIQTRVLDSQNAEQSKRGGLEIKFLNAPVAFSNVSQFLYLPKKAYELSINYTVDEIRGPNPISIKLICDKSKTELAEIELPKTKAIEEVKTVSFEVPSNDCDLQKILISNNNIVESWQNRFSGKVILHEISISIPNT